MEKWIKAGAGCGKTTYIIKNAKEEDIYLTFNIANKVQAKARGCKAQVWTFNGMGNQLIKENKIDWVKEYGLPNDPSGLLIAQEFVLNDYAKEWPSCETLFVDEVQDLNDEMIEAIQKLKWKNLVLVGDENQAIMGWNGVSFFDWRKPFPNIEIEHLSQSYRFGKEVANYSNDFRDNPLSPNVKINSKVVKGGLEELLKTEGTKAILVATNKGVHDWRKKLSQENILWTGKVGGGRLIDTLPEEIVLEKDKSLYKTYPFKSMIIKEIAKTSKDYTEFFNRIWDWGKTNKEAIYIETIHKTKGLEFDNVLVDFCYKGENQEKKNLYYVAITRAKQTLILEKGKHQND